MLYKEFLEKSFITPACFSEIKIEGNFGFQILNAECLLKVKVGGTISFISCYMENEVLFFLR